MLGAAFRTQPEGLNISIVLRKMKIIHCRLHPSLVGGWVKCFYPLVVSLLLRDINCGELVAAGLAYVTCHSATAPGFAMICEPSDVRPLDPWVREKSS